MSAQDHRLVSMVKPAMDFSHLTAAERIQLAEDLWDSLEPETVALTDPQITELRRRRAELHADGDAGEPWEEVLKDIEERGA